MIISIFVFSRSQFVEIRYVLSNAVTKRKQINVPVLKSYEFIPNEANLSILNSLQVALQIVIENTTETKLKIVEVNSNDNEPLSGTINDIIKNHPIIQADIQLFDPKHIFVEGVLVQNKSLAAEKDCNLIIASNLSKTQYVSNNNGTTAFHPSVSSSIHFLIYYYHRSKSFRP